MGRGVLKDREEAEQSAAVVPKANTTSWTGHTNGGTRLGNRCARHEAENISREAGPDLAH